MSPDDDTPSPNAARPDAAASAEPEPEPELGHPPSRPSGDVAADIELDEVDVKDLLRRALDPPTGAGAPDLLPAVQRRIRVESRGKFFADGWSTTVAPRSTFLVTSLVMLLVTVVLWMLLAPLGIDIVR
jgi:hypothetical protein